MCVHYQHYKGLQQLLTETACMYWTGSINLTVRWIPSPLDDHSWHVERVVNIVITTCGFITADVVTIFYINFAIACFPCEPSTDVLDKTTEGLALIS